MRRREFIGGLAGATAWPLTVRAQQREPARTGKRPLLGYLAVASPETAAPQKTAFFDGLRELGYVEGRDYDIQIRWGHGDISRLGALAKELIDLQPTLLLANPTPAVLAIRALTRDIPIISFM